MCGGETGYQAQSSDTTPAEVLLARVFKEDLGVTIEPQALRIFIRWRWDRVKTLAHRIHEGL
jgi:hypothetical protein